MTQLALEIDDFQTEIYALPTRRRTKNVFKWMLCRSLERRSISQYSSVYGNRFHRSFCLRLLLVNRPLFNRVLLRDYCSKAYGLGFEGRLKIPSRNN